MRWGGHRGGGERDCLRDCLCRCCCCWSGSNGCFLRRRRACRFVAFGTQFPDEPSLAGISRVVRLSSLWRGRRKYLCWWRRQRVLGGWEAEKRRWWNLSAGWSCCIVFMRHSIRRRPLMFGLFHTGIYLGVESHIHFVCTIVHWHEQRTRRVHRGTQTLSQRPTFPSCLAPFRHGAGKWQENVVHIFKPGLSWSRTGIPRCVLHRRGRE